MDKYLTFKSSRPSSAMSHSDTSSWPASAMSQISDEEEMIMLETSSQVDGQLLHDNIVRP